MLGTEDKAKLNMKPPSLFPDGEDRDGSQNLDLLVI